MNFDKFNKVESLLKPYEKGYVPAGKYQVQVKLDGANAGIIRTDTGLALHSRNTFLGNLQADNLGTFGGLSGFVEFIRERFEYLFTALEVGDHVYGEWLVPHTITYPQDMYKKFYVFDSSFRDITNQELGILATPILGDIDIRENVYESGKDLVDRVLSLAKPYLDNREYKTEGFVLTRFNLEDGYSKDTNRFKVILPEFREEKGEKWQDPNAELPIEVRMAAEYSIRSYEKIKEKVKDLKNAEDLNHSHIGAVLGLAWHDYLTEFLVDVVTAYKLPTVRFKVLKGEFDNRIREILLSELNTGTLPAWAATQAVRENV